MGDPTRGLFDKFIVSRVDGTSEPGAKHDGCRYFVLDLTHDKFSDAAILAYADACRDEYPLLARDLYQSALVAPDSAPADKETK